MKEGQEIVFGVGPFHPAHGTSDVAQVATAGEHQVRAFRQLRRGIVKFHQVVRRRIIGPVILDPGTGQVLVPARAVSSRRTAL